MEIDIRYVGPNSWPAPADHDRRHLDNGDKVTADVGWLRQNEGAIQAGVIEPFDPEQSRAVRLERGGSLVAPDGQRVDTGDVFEATDDWLLTHLRLVHGGAVVESEGSTEDREVEEQDEDALRERLDALAWRDLQGLAGDLEELTGEDVNRKSRQSCTEFALAYPDETDVLLTDYEG